MRRVLIGFCIFWLALPVFAVEPDEVLSDPALEARARALSAGLRCMVCQNQSIDESDAPLAKDLRLLVRERLAAGDTDPEVIDFLVARYGQFILLKPRFGGVNALLWVTPIAVLLFAVGLVILYARRQKGLSLIQDRSLTDEERAKLEKILTS